MSLTQIFKIVKDLEQEYYDIHSEIVLKYRQYNKITKSQAVLLTIENKKPIAYGNFEKIKTSSMKIKIIFINKNIEKKK